MHTLPFVSVLNDDPDTRFPVTVREGDGHCECEDEHCTALGYTLGTDDGNAPVFCPFHFRQLHLPDGQSHLEPMTAEELPFLS